MSERPTGGSHLHLGDREMHAYDIELRVHEHIRALEREAANERVARTARARQRRPGGSIRAVVGNALIAIGATIAARRRLDDPCAENGVTPA